MSEWTAFLLLSPFVGFLVNGWNWRSSQVLIAGWIGSIACGLSFISSLFLFGGLLSSSQEFFTVSFIPWVKVGNLDLSFSFLVDPLSVLMLLIITGVGFLIHLFSVYYMAEDKRPARYFAYLNLFLLSMMILVLADHLLLMFVGWEGVGLCSYLLIGFWFQDEKKSRAGMKAFIVNRIGDLGFLLGMFILFFYFGSLKFQELDTMIMEGEVLNIFWVNIACLCLLIGAIGKSAQIPLFVWLPSAMAGPTPVSALIHAATMVTAGIYLMGRLTGLLSLAHVILSWMGWIGAIGALVSALFACVQSDIKKVLAYSTISQLGYMFSAMGIGAFSTGFFHLMTHAFFKALLFLSAGSIIHSLQGEQNIWNMGGLRKHLPWTWVGVLVGSASLMGLPPFCGFFSKDEILWKAFSSGNIFVFILLFLTALLTAFYITRLVVCVFYVCPKKDFSQTLHEGGIGVLIPLSVLSVLSIGSGILGIPHLWTDSLGFHFPHLLEWFLQPVFSAFPLGEKALTHGSLVSEVLLMGGSVLGVVSVGVLTAFLYLKKPLFLETYKRKHLLLFNWLKNGGGVDDFYRKQIVTPVLNLSQELASVVDIKCIQGMIFFVRKWIQALREVFSFWQSKDIQYYILFMLLGLIVFILGILLG